ncbi:MAG: hypothetical protein AAF171_08660 [Cyanobacteria bacterium P01_A01_bin.116]
MSTLIEIAAAIQELPEADMRELSTWLQNALDERWDRQLESDVAAGKLDQLIANAEADINKGHVRELDEVLRDV